MEIAIRDFKSLSQGTSYTNVHSLPADKIAYMDKSATEIHYGICIRTKRLRQARGIPATQMAEWLGVSIDAYKKYEFRTPMPHEHMDHFLSITRSDANFLISNIGSLPATAQKSQKVRRLRKAL
jgi:hypothetical protein